MPPMKKQEDGSKKNPKRPFQRSQPATELEMAGPDFEEVTADFNILEHLHDVPDGDLDLRRRRFMDDIAASTRRVEKVFVDCKRVNSPENQLKSLKELYEETGEQPSSFFMYQLGEAFWPKHVPKSLMPPPKGGKVTVKKEIYLPTMYVVRIEEEITRLQGVLFHNVSLDLQNFTEKCKLRLQMLNDVSEWLTGQQSILDKHLFSFYDASCMFEEEGSLALYRRLHSFMEHLEKAVHQTRNLAGQLFGLGSFEKDPSQKKDKKTGKINMVKLTVAQIPTAGVMLKNKDKFGWGVRKVIDILQLCQQMTNSPFTKKTLECGLQLFNNMMQVIEENFEHMESADQSMSDLHKKLAQTCKALEDGASKLVEVEKEHEALVDQHQGVTKKLSKVVAENDVLKKKLGQLGSVLSGGLGAERMDTLKTKEPQAIREIQQQALSTGKPQALSKGKPEVLSEGRTGESSKAKPGALGQEKPGALSEKPGALSTEKSQVASEDSARQQLVKSLPSLTAVQKQDTLEIFKELGISPSTSAMGQSPQKQKSSAVAETSENLLGEIEFYKDTVTHLRYKIDKLKNYAALLEKEIGPMAQKFRDSLYPKQDAAAQELLVNAGDKVEERRVAGLEGISLPDDIAHPQLIPSPPELSSLGQKVSTAPEVVCSPPASRGTGETSGKEAVAGALMTTDPNQIPMILTTQEESDVPAPLEPTTSTSPTTETNLGPTICTDSDAKVIDKTAEDSKTKKLSTGARKTSGKEKETLSTATEPVRKKSSKTSTEPERKKSSKTSTEPGRKKSSKTVKEPERKKRSMTTTEPEKKKSLKKTTEPETKESLRTATEPETKESLQTATEQERKESLKKTMEQERKESLKKTMEQEREKGLDKTLEQEREKGLQTPTEGRQRESVKASTGPERKSLTLEEEGKDKEPQKAENVKTPTEREQPFSKALTQPERKPVKTDVELKDEKFRREETLKITVEPKAKDAGELAVESKTGDALKIAAEPKTPSKPIIKQTGLSISKEPPKVEPRPLTTPEKGKGKDAEKPKPVEKERVDDNVQKYTPEQKPTKIEKHQYLLFGKKTLAHSHDMSTVEYSDDINKCNCPVCLQLEETPTASEPVPAPAKKSPKPKKTVEKESQKAPPPESRKRPSLPLQAESQESPKPSVAVAPQDTDADIRSVCLNILRQFLSLGRNLASVFESHQLKDLAEEAKQVHATFADVICDEEYDVLLGLTQVVETYFNQLQSLIQKALSGIDTRKAEERIIKMRQEKIQELNQKTAALQTKQSSLEDHFRSLWFMHLVLCQAVLNKRQNKPYASVQEDAVFNETPVTAAEDGLKLPKGIIQSNQTILAEAFRDNKISQKCLEAGQECLETLDNVYSGHLPFLVRLFVIGQRLAETEALAKQHCRGFSEDDPHHHKWTAWCVGRSAKLTRQFQQVLVELLQWRTEKPSIIFKAWFLFNQILLETGVRLVCPQPAMSSADEAIRSYYSKTVKELSKRNNIRIPLINLDTFQELVAEGKLPSSFSKRALSYGSDSSMQLDNRQSVTNAVAPQGFAVKPPNRASSSQSRAVQRPNLLYDNQGPKRLSFERSRSIEDTLNEVDEQG